MMCFTELRLRSHLPYPQSLNTGSWQEIRRDCKIYRSSWPSVMTSSSYLFAAKTHSFESTPLALVS